MPRALRTRTEIEAELLAARARVIDAEDQQDIAEASKARARCDRLTEQWARTRP